MQNNQFTQEHFNIIQELDAPIRDNIADIIKYSLSKDLVCVDAIMDGFIENCKELGPVQLMAIRNCLLAHLPHPQIIPDLPEYPFEYGIPITGINEWFVIYLYIFEMYFLIIYLGPKSMVIFQDSILIIEHILSFHDIVILQILH